MKIIDIAIKVANKEEIPMFKYEDRIYKYNELHEWFDDINDDSRCKMEFYPSELNDEVEIVDNEEWKTIEDFPNYEISTKGNVRTKEYFDGRNHIRQSKLLNKQVNNVGYEYVILSNEIVKHKTLTVHRLMAKTFLDDYFDTLDVNHINGIKTDNRIENLEMATHSENIKKRYEIGIDGNNYKAVEQYDLDGNYIATYKSSYEAEKITNICRTSIGSCCRKEEGHYTAGGYIWKFKEEKEIEKKIEKIIISMDDDSMPYVTNNKYQKLSYSEVDLLFASKINGLIEVINDMRDKE